MTGFAWGAGHSRLAGAAAGGGLAGAAIQNSLHVVVSLVPHKFCQWEHASLERHIFTDGSSSGSGTLRRVGWAVVAVDNLGNLKSVACGAVPVDVLTERCDLGCAPDHDGPAHNCAGTIATTNGPKCSGLWSQREKGSRLEQPFFAPTTRLLRSRSTATRRRQTCRQGGPLSCSDMETISQMCSQKRAPTHASRLCTWPKLIWPALPWPSKLCAGRPKRMWSCDHAAGATRWVLQGQRQGCAAQEQGQSGSEERRWQCQRQVRLPTGWRCSHPRGSRTTVNSTHAPSGGYCLQIARVLNQGGRAVDRPIVFCTKCGAVNWERAHALCRSCRQIPGGCAF